MDETDNDNYRQRFAQYILAEYTDYYNYWVVKKGYELPRDRVGCQTWNGCSLSFPYGNAKVPEGYSYSINSLEDGVLFKQNGQIPNASINNVAIYKRARCGSNGTVIGGSERKDVAAVIKRLDGTYYCVEN